MRNRSASCLTSQYWRRVVVTASASSRELQNTRHLRPRVCSKMYPMPGSAISGAESVAGSGTAAAGLESVAVCRCVPSREAPGVCCRTLPSGLASNATDAPVLATAPVPCAPAGSAGACSINGRPSPSTACGFAAYAGARSPLSEACGPALKKCSIDSRQVCPVDSIRGTTVLFPVPALRNSAACCGSPIVADRPMRRGLTPAIRESRSTRHRVCPPRSPRINACSSSMTMNRRSPNSALMAA